MKRKKLRRIENGQLAGHVDDEAADDSLYETDLERDSAACYERRRKMWAEFNQGDWWIAVAVYLILFSIALVVL